MSAHLLLLAPLSLLRLEFLARALPVGRQLVDVARQLLVGGRRLVELFAQHRVDVTQTRRALLLLLQLHERSLDVHVVVGLAQAQTVLARVQTPLQLVLLLGQLKIKRDTPDDTCSEHTRETSLRVPVTSTKVYKEINILPVIRYVL